MARKTIGERPLTGAERARRHREKVRASKPADLFTKLIEENRALRAELRKLKYRGHAVGESHAQTSDEKAVAAHVAEFESLDDNQKARAARAAAAFKAAL